MFKDEAIIEVIGGHGGAGVVSWRREKFVSKGGPDGGDGGRGGNIYIVANDNTDTLSNFLSKKKFKAESGGNGEKRNRHGKNGEDLLLTVPSGTLVYHENEILADLRVSGDKVLVAQGGRGGFGNAHFKSSVRQRPDFAELGEPAERSAIRLDLKLVADVGIIGFPSVGKSTLIAAISAARPKIAEYEFTTLIPNLGVVQMDSRSYVVCDVPGIIEGASEGKGLGHKFLRHIERCGFLLHMLDINRALLDGEFNPQKLIDNYKVIRAELEKYSPTLAQKKELIILNKSDLYQGEIHIPGLEIFATISAATRQGTDELIQKLLPIVLEEREQRTAFQDNVSEEVPVLRPQEGQKMGSYTVTENEDGSITVTGKRLEQLAVMTDFSNEGAAYRFRDICEKIGLRKALKKYGEDVQIWIGEKELPSDVL